MVVPRGVKGVLGTVKGDVGSAVGDWRLATGDWRRREPEPSSSIGMSAIPRCARD